MNKYHRDLTMEDIHSLHAWQFFNEKERLSLTELGQDDVGKLALQLTPLSMWALMSVSPIAWMEIADAAAQLCLLHKALDSHSGHSDVHHPRYTDAEAEEIAASVVLRHTNSTNAHHERYTDDEARRAVGLEALRYNESDEALGVAGKVIVNASDLYDVWVEGQANGSDSRRTALVGTRKDGRLHVNWRGQYPGGLVLGGEIATEAMPSADPGKEGVFWQDHEGYVHRSSGGVQYKPLSARMLQTGQTQPSTGEVMVQFPRPFAEPPIVTLTPWSDVRVWLQEVQPAYFVWRSDQSAVTINWTAIER